MKHFSIDWWHRDSYKSIVTLTFFFLEQNFSTQLNATHSWRSDDHACPVGELNVVLWFESPRYRAVPAALLTHLELLQQTEAARHHFEKTECRLSIWHKIRRSSSRPALPFPGETLIKCQASESKWHYLDYVSHQRHYYPQLHCRLHHSSSECETLSSKRLML